MTGAEEPGQERYRILRLLGRGAFGEVLLAEDRRFARQVAVKRLSAAVPDHATRLRFAREARLTAAVRHPHVVELLDTDFDEEGRPRLVYEYLEGEDLERRLGTTGALGREQARRLGIELASALACLHAAGILHRDLKPSNVLLRPDGSSVLLDLGLAKASSESEALTATGSVVGTPAFMAPELLLGHPPSPASDQWSWGALLHLAACGTRLGAEGGLAAHLNRAQEGTPPPLDPALVALDRDLAEVVRRAVDPAPGKRFPSLEAAGEALRSEHPVPAGPRPGRLSAAPIGMPGAAAARGPAGRPWGWRPLAPVLACLLAAGWWWSSHRRPPTDADPALPVGAQDPDPSRPEDTRRVEDSRSRPRRRPWTEVGDPEVDAALAELRSLHPRWSLSWVSPGSADPRGCGVALSDLLDPRLPLRWARLLERLERWLVRLRRVEDPALDREPWADHPALMVVVHHVAEMGILKDPVAALMRGVFESPPRIGLQASLAEDALRAFQECEASTVAWLEGEPAAAELAGASDSELTLRLCLSTSSVRARVGDLLRISLERLVARGSRDAGSWLLSATAHLLASNRDPEVLSCRDRLRAWDAIFPDPPTWSAPAHPEQLRKHHGSRMYWLSLRVRSALPCGTEGDLEVDRWVEGILSELPPPGEGSDQAVAVPLRDIAQTLVRFGQDRAIRGIPEAGLESAKARVTEAQRARGLL